MCVCVRLLLIELDQVALKFDVDVVNLKLGTVVDVGEKSFHAVKSS